MLERPKPVSIAVALLYLGIAFVAIEAIMDIASPKSAAQSPAIEFIGGTAFSTIVAIGVLGFSLIFPIMIGRAKNWARII